MIVTNEGFLLYSDFAGLVDEEFKDAVLQDRTPMEAWHILGDYPHLMLTVAHKSDGRREYLLRGELLTIAAVMISRLRSQRFAQHTVIPVSNSHPNSPVPKCSFFIIFVLKSLQISELSR